MELLHSPAKYMTETKIKYTRPLELQKRWTATDTTSFLFVADPLIYGHISVVDAAENI